MKSIIQYTVIIGMFIMAGFIGHFIQQNLHSLGITFITLQDVILCYFIPVVSIGALGVYIGAIYLEEKLK